MSRENLKVISVRLDEDLLKKLDEAAQRHIYWSRSDIIRNILIAALNEMSAGDLYNMIRYYQYNKNVVDAKFEITNELKPYGKK